VVVEEEGWKETSRKRKLRGVVTFFVCCELDVRSFLLDFHPVTARLPRLCGSDAPHSILTSSCPHNLPCFFNPSPRCLLVFVQTSSSFLPLTFSHFADPGTLFFAQELLFAVTRRHISAPPQLAVSNCSHRLRLWILVLRRLQHTNDASKHIFR
jgi:hypothetical protein